MRMEMARVKYEVKWDEEKWSGAEWSGAEREDRYEKLGDFLTFQHVQARGISHTLNLIGV